MTKKKSEPAAENSPSADGPLKARLNEAWLEELRAKILPIQKQQAAVEQKRLGPAWDLALRKLRKDGDPQLLGALLWRATPDGEGSTPLPTRAVYALAEIFAPGKPHERPLLTTEKDPPSVRETAQRHEQYVRDMLTLIEEEGEKVNAAAEKIAKKSGVSRGTVLTAWANAKKLPFVNDIGRQARKNRKRPRQI